MLTKQKDGSFPEADENVRAAAQSSLAEINARLRTTEIGLALFSGVSLGSILLLAALGLAITYGLMGIINMAHGEFLMIGAYATYVVQGIFRSHFPGAFDWYVVAALPVAFAVTAAIGMALERGVLRWLYGRPLETLLTTWGVSLLLIQASRMIFGAQNVEVENPSWLSGGIVFGGGYVLPFNRMVIVLFALTVLAAVWLVINRTRMGLFVRGVTQNRAMASCTGVPTNRVDMLTFGLGSGVAGLGGVALSQIGNVGPDLGQSYIVDSFMVVVLGGVGQLAGTVIAAFGLGSIAKFLEPWSGAVLAKIMVLDLHHPLHPETSSRAVRVEGAECRGMTRLFPLQAWTAIFAVTAVLLVVIPVLHLAVPESSAFHVSSFWITLLGKFMCYAVVALAMDLIWGYTGILSLGQGLFFALGGYAFGMYLMRQIGRDGVYQSDLPDFMVFLDWKELPWYWMLSDSFVWTMILVVAVPGLIAFVFGFFAFRSRIKGVYFSIITQALTYAAMLAFFRNDMGFGGNNGFTDFKRVLGFPITAPGTRTALYVLSGLVLLASLLLARWVVASKLGRVLTAIRDQESRLMFLGYRTLYFKLFIWTLAAVMSGVAGALYVPQVGIINPGEMSPANSIEIAIWAAVGGRGTLFGPILGAFAVNGAKTWFTVAYPELWLYFLGLLFVLVTLLLPRGLMGLAASLRLRRSPTSRETAVGGEAQEARS